MEKLFKLKEHNTSVKTEIVAGITTFLSMVYILAVNPTILADGGMDSAGVFTATAISAAVASLLMAFFANYPIVLASGMGINAYFAYSVCIPLANEGIVDPWKIALAAVFTEGIVFVLLSLCNFREKLVNDVPENLKYGITVGIGLFIVIIGLQNAGIVADDPATLIAMGSFRSPEMVLALIGLIIIAVLYQHKVPGYILLGILITWGLGMIAQLTGWYQVNPDAGAFSLFPNFSGKSLLPAAPAVFSFDFQWIAGHAINFIVIVFSFLYVDLFDTVGTLIGIGAKADLLDEEGNLPKAKGALMADACGTIIGACLGTSTVTSYTESCTGVASGGRTGLTAVTAAVLFLVSLFFAPFFLAIPSFATAPVLIWVGLMMMTEVKKIDFEGDIADVVGGFLALIIMPFTYSIANGIMFGILAWVILKVLTGKAKDIPLVMWIAFILFGLRVLTLVI